MKEDVEEEVEEEKKSCNGASVVIMYIFIISLATTCALTCRFDFDTCACAEWVCVCVAVGVAHFFFSNSPVAIESNVLTSTRTPLRFICLDQIVIARQNLKLQLILEPNFFIDMSLLNSHFFVRFHSHSNTAH